MRLTFNSPLRCLKMLLGEPGAFSTTLLSMLDKIKLAKTGTGISYLFMLVMFYNILKYVDICVYIIGYTSQNLLNTAMGDNHWQVRNFIHGNAYV